MIHSIDQWVFELRRHRIQDQKGLWINSFFRQMAYSLMAMFSMIFVFEFGRGGFWKHDVMSGLVLVLVYLLILRLVVILGVIVVAEKVVRRWGYRKSVLISLVLSSGSFLALAAASIWGGVGWVVVSAVLMGLVICTYWVTYFSLFAEDVGTKSTGSSFGILDGVSRLGQVIAPLVAAGIVVKFGYASLFVVGAVLLMVAGLPMFFLGHHLHLDKVSWREFGRWSKEKTFVRAGLAMGGRLIDDSMYADLWPIYVFLLVGSVGSLGWFKSVVLLATAVFSVLTGRLFDRKEAKKYQVVGVSGGVILWVIRAVVKNLPQIMLVDSVDQFFTTTSRNYFFVCAFKRASGPETFSFVVYWILWQSMWVAMVYVVLLVLVVELGVGAMWMGLLGLGALGLLMSLLIEEHHT